MWLLQTTVTKSLGSMGTAPLCPAWSQLGLQALIPGWWAARWKALFPHFKTSTRAVHPNHGGVLFTPMEHL